MLYWKESVRTVQGTFTNDEDATRAVARLSLQILHADIGGTLSEGGDELIMPSNAYNSAYFKIERVMMSFTTYAHLIQVYTRAKGDSGDGVPVPQGYVGLCSRFEYNETTLSVLFHKLNNNNPDVLMYYSGLFGGGATDLSVVSDPFILLSNRAIIVGKAIDRPAIRDLIDLGDGHILSGLKVPEPDIPIYCTTKVFDMAGYDYPELKGSSARRGIVGMGERVYYSADGTLIQINET